MGTKRGYYDIEVAFEDAMVENGMIDGIRFTGDEAFMFVFALENNLVLTMSKLDLFGEIEMDYPEKEAKLIIKS